MVSHKIRWLFIEYSRNKSSAQRTENASNTDKETVTDTIQSLADQRTNDLLENINRHALPKKVKLYKEAFAHAEGLKIKKFEDKCKKNEEIYKYIQTKHDEILKSKMIKKILKEEQDKEINVIFLRIINLEKQRVV